MARIVRPLTPDGIQTYPLRSRPSKVGVADFAKPLVSGATVAELLASLPNFWPRPTSAASSRPAARPEAAASRSSGRMGAHVIKVGLSPVLIDLMREGWVDGLAFNGAGIIHDFEIAFAGRTSEDVEDRIRDGRFGMAKETGERLNKAIREGAADGLGLGRAVGRMIAGSKFPYRDLSLLGTAAELEIPCYRPCGCRYGHHPCPPPGQRRSHRPDVVAGLLQPGRAGQGARTAAASTSTSARPCSCRRSSSRPSRWSATRATGWTASRPRSSTSCATTGRPRM